MTDLLLVLEVKLSRLLLFLNLALTGLLLGLNLTVATYFWTDTAAVDPVVSMASVN